MNLSEDRIMMLKKLIQSEKTITVKKISSTFKISEVTARRDLERLKKEGFILKVHGGAVLREFGQLESEPVFENRLNQNKEEKIRIAKEASKRINNGDMVIIESGTTCFYLIDYLIDKEDLKIATCGIPIANELIRLFRIKKNFTIVVSGGIVRLDAQVYTGPNTTNFFNEINADIAFIAALGISAEKGISTDNYFDAEIVRKIISSSTKVILLCDSSKFNQHSYINIASLEKIDELITDDGITRENIDKIKNIGIKLTIV